MVTKIRIEIVGGAVQNVAATGPVEILFVDHDFQDGCNATIDGIDVVTWTSEIALEQCETEEQFAAAVTWMRTPSM